ncbi:FGGY-family carbohydrate kinase [Cellulomonas pakistanensis]|uniref:Xylulokinase n=1 Tax=Cellulomonas pakistanensis TaxID=992287 RepID=A0A919PC30_9CELL|nr:FGGY family carbohydrate kinase [Cellulomonas pakistanensis]GIG35872.1 xylulokinase [Cellulomonas pakistanensis]
MSRLLGLGIDVGTTNTKVALVAAPQSAADGAVDLLAVASAPTPEPAALDRVLRELTVRALAAAGRSTGVRRPVPLAVGAASMAETGVPLDADGRALGRWVRWDGHRAAAEAAGLADRLGATALFEATGVRPSAKVPLATLAWLAAHDPERRAALARWAGVADLVALRMTGDLVTDHTLAGRSMAYRLPPAGADLPSAFDADLLAEVGLEPAHLPRVAAPDALAGSVRPGPWVAAGLRAGTPVSVAGHDHAVGAWAAGVRDRGHVADSIGTAEALCAVLAADPVRADVARAGMSLVRTVTGRPALLAGSSSAGAMVRWWLEHEAGGRSADDLFAAVAALPRDQRAADAVVLPYVSGRQTPDPDPAARARVLGRGAHGTVPLTAAMLDGLALHARWMLDAQLALGAAADPGLRPERLLVLGGPATRNAAWMRAKSELGPVPLRVVGCAEPVAAGAALIALHRTGLLDPDDPPVLPVLPGLPDGAPLPAPRADAEDALARFVRAARDPDPAARGARDPDPLAPTPGGHP